MGGEMSLWPLVRYYDHFTHETKGAVAIALQAFSLVEKAEPAHVCFTLPLIDQRRK